ncbi:MAG: exonuclease SbcCD subunit D [Candidatus Heimdallarchaeota archaeon]
MRSVTDQGNLQLKEHTTRLDKFLKKEVSPDVEVPRKVEDEDVSIIVVADIHAGLNFDFKIDPDTGISERARDFHHNFVRAAQYAIEHKSRLFVVLGDLFERAHVSPTFREWIRSGIIEPLGEAGVEIWLVAGNHEQPKSPARGTSIQDFRGYPHVKVFMEATEERLEIEEKSIGVLIIPYLHPEQVIRLTQKDTSQKVSIEQQFQLGQRILQDQILKKAESLQTDFKALFAHYYIEGAKLRETRYLTVLPSEFKFTLDMIPNNLDLAIFGHVHLHQVVGKRGSTEILYPGAIERIDWGERKDKKGFLIIKPFAPQKWEFIELPTREMVKISVQVLMGTEDPTAVILAKIPQNITGKMIRLEIESGEGIQEKILESKIEEKLKGAFHYEIRITELHTEKIAPVSFTMDPFKLFDEFINLNYNNHSKKEQILQIGRQLMAEVFQ